MPLSLQQAASATGKEKSTISRAIKSGRMSAVITESGTYQIDPAELFRVFPPKPAPDDNTGSMQQNASDKSSGAPGEVASENRELRARVELLGEMMQQLKTDRDRERALLEDQLRREKEQADYWRQQATGLLTHQPEPQRQPPIVRPWLWVILLVTAALAGGYVLLVRNGWIYDFR